MWYDDAAVAQRDKQSGEVMSSPSPRLQPRPPVSSPLSHHAGSCASVMAEHENDSLGQSRLRDQLLRGGASRSRCSNGYIRTRPSPSSSPRPSASRQQPAATTFVRFLRALISLFFLVATCTSLLGAASAHETTNAIDQRSTPEHGHHSDSSTSSTARDAVAVAAVSDPLHVDQQQLVPAWKGPSLLVVDTRPPPESPLMRFLQPDPDLHLQRRQNNNNNNNNNNDNDNDNDATSTVKPSSSATSTSTSPASKSTLQTDPKVSQTPFAVPQPFDTSLSNNFTQPCANFWRRLLTDKDFQTCHPFSLLLQTSNSFFQASRSFVRITQTLEATCAANVTVCTNVMGGLARELISDANCAADYQSDNPLVLQAYNGLIAYEPLYQASCLQDNDGNYCYANAATNTTNPAATGDSYPYYLPLGQPLQPGTRPTCNTCLQDVMAIFSSFAGNATQPISKTYNAAAAQIQIGCGPSFVNKTATPLKGAAPATATASFAPTLTLMLMLFLLCFQ